MQTKVTHHVRIEVNYWGSWRVRQEGDVEWTREALMARFPVYCLGHPHRFYIDGELVLKWAP